MEFTGTPRTGKTTLINNLNDFFKKGGFGVNVLEEFTTSKRYKQTIYPLLKEKPRKEINFEIPKYVLKDLEENLKNNFDIIIVDRCLFDRLIWIDRLYLDEGINNDEYNEFKDLYVPLINKNINIIIASYTDSLTSLKRDYRANLSLEKRNFLNEKNIFEYNRSLLNMRALAIEKNISFNLFDTTDKTEREIAIEVADAILNDMRKFYLKQVDEEFS